MGEEGVKANVDACGQRGGEVKFCWDCVDVINRCPQILVNYETALTRIIWLSSFQSIKQYAKLFFQWCTFFKFWHQRTFVDCKADRFQFTLIWKFATYKHQHCTQTITGGIKSTKVHIKIYRQPNNTTNVDEAENIITRQHSHFPLIVQICRKLTGER